MDEIKPMKVNIKKEISVASVNGVQLAIRLWKFSSGNLYTYIRANQKQLRNTQFYLAIAGAQVRFLAGT